MRRILAVCALTAGVLAPAAGAFGTAAAQSTQPADNSGVGIALLDPPPSDDPRTQVYIVDHVAPGAILSRQVQITNNSGGSVTVLTYAAGAAISKGQFVGAEGKTANELSSWTRLSTDKVELRNGEKAAVTVTVAVPKTATTAERYAAVWAELPPARTASGTTVVNRVGIRVYLSVGPGAAPATDFAITGFTGARSSAGIAEVLVGVRNTGGRAIDLSGELRLTDGPGGAKAGAYSAQLGTTLAPGDTGAVRVPTEAGITGGPWTATAALRSGVTTRTGSGSIEFPTASGTTASPIASGAPSPAATASSPGTGTTGSAAGDDDDEIPWWVFVAVGFGLVLLLLLLILLLRRRRREPEPELAPTVASVLAATAPPPPPATAPPAPAAVAPSLEKTLRELATGPVGVRRIELLEAAASHGVDALRASPLLPTLPVDVASDLGRMVAARR